MKSSRWRWPEDPTLFNPCSYCFIMKYYYLAGSYHNDNLFIFLTKIAFIYIEVYTQSFLSPKYQVKWIIHVNAQNRNARNKNIETYKVPFPYTFRYPRAMMIIALYANIASQTMMHYLRNTVTTNLAISLLLFYYRI